jgi:putative SOS response-associated peptidase YedK
MCGRYTLTSPPARIAEQFDLPAAETAALRPRYNVAPGQELPIVHAFRGSRAIESVQWGLRGFDGKALPHKAINARIETAGKLDVFADALFGCRCLVPADGYFEWRRRAGGPEPHWISFPDRAVFAFAGLCDVPWKSESEVGSMAILTRPARGRLRELHDRMPVLVAPADYAAWLDPARQDIPASLALCESALSEGLGFRPVDPRVNDVRFDDPACLDPSPQLAWF